MWNKDAQMTKVMVVSSFSPGISVSHIASIDADENKVAKQKLDDLEIKEDWLLVHRVDLHSGLRDHVLNGIEGKRPTIHLASPVKSVVSYLHT